MIKFSNAELLFIKEQFTYSLQKMNDLEEDDFMDYINSVGRDNINSAIDIIGLDDIHNINTNEDLNVMAKHSIYWIFGYFVWTDRYMNGSEIYAYIDDEEYCSIYDKIILDDED